MENVDILHTVARLSEDQHFFFFRIILKLISGYGDMKLDRKKYL